MSGSDAREALPPNVFTARVPARPAALPRTIGFLGAVGVMAGVMIGSGIFRTPRDIAGALPNPTLVLALWAAGGLLALCGALAYSELAAMFPQSGGVYVFLREAFGRPLAFVFGWTYMLVAKPLAAAGIAVVFAESFRTLTGVPVHPALISAALIILLTALNVRGAALGANISAALTILKAALLVVLVVLVAVMLGVPLGRLSVAPAAAGATAGTSPATFLTWLAPLSAAMTLIMWTYDGWADVGAIAGEVTAPQKTLPRVYLIGTASVALLYILFNGAAFIALDPAEIAGHPGDPDAAKNVAGLIAARFIGPVGLTLAAGVLFLSTLGSTHASILTGARVTYQQAADGLMFAPLARVHPRYATPAVALWVQCTLSCIAAFIGDFGTLASGFAFTMWIFYGLGGVALIVLRIRRPEQARPFRCPLYPIVPIVFIASAVAMTAATIATSPGPSAAWLGVLLVGFPVYLVWERLGARARMGAQDDAGVSSDRGA
ncbi:amino acid permease [soil metagenome]